MAAVAADRRLDPPAPRARPASNEREVLALERAPPNEALQPAECLLAPRHHEQTRRVAVEAVDDARALRRPAGRTAAAQRPRERSPRAAGPGMDDDTRWLVDDQQVLVLPGDARARQARAPPAGSGCGLEAARHESPPRRPGGGSSAGRPVDEHRSAATEPLGGRARAHRGLLREEPVEPQARGRLRYAERDQERSVEAPCRRRGLRSPASIVPSSSTTPTTMQTSARLKAGQ